MIEGLLWQGLEIAEVEDRKPSWSWTSINGIPANALVGRWEPLACVLDCHVVVQGKSQFGAVADAWIKMEAPLVPLIYDQNDPIDAEMQPPIFPKNLYFHTPHGKTSGSYGRFDFIGNKHIEAEDLARAGGLFALILAVGVGSNSRNYFSLIVAPVEGELGRHMKRMGFLNQDIESLGVDEARSLRTIVTLV
jgi:hypothetical protein